MPKHRRYSAPAGEPQLARAARRARGVYYTPPEIVRLIVDLTLQPAMDDSSQPPRVIDPACGAGEFLVAAAERLTSRYRSAATVQGIDIDAGAIKFARQRLPAECQVWQANALDCEAAADGTFDVVLGNPPYLSIRQLAKSLPAAELTALRERFRTARGNFDLYVLFIERALALLKPGGRCGLIVPNKWATLDYARPCRELLLEQATLEHVVDLSNERVFAEASVYPHVIVFRKRPAKSNHTVRFRSFDPQPEAQAGGENRIPQRVLSPAAFSFAEPLDVESRVATQPLGELATLSCGTAGYAAQRTAQCLVDQHTSPQREQGSTASHPGSCCGLVWDFITSGNIDRYAIRLGNVRYLGRTYEQPRLPADAPELSSAKRRLFRSPKIVVAGMSRRLEAAWDERGLALGVQVFAASECQVDPFYLLALLNSKLLSYLFATRFAAKRLAGGYLAINKGQLALLPIVEQESSPAHARLGELGRLLSGQARGLSYEEEADRLVYRLYQLSTGEIARVESHFTQPAARAA